jgi:hypothetical protein
VKRKDLRKEQHKRGRRLVGWFVTWPDGRKAYICNKRQRDIFRRGHSTIVEADIADDAAWAIDVDIVNMARVKGCQVLGVITKETRHIYLAPIEYFDPANGLTFRYTGKGAGMVDKRFLPLQYFKTKFAPIRL